MRGVLRIQRNNPISLEMLQGILERTNLVYHDWEVTGSRINQWFYMGKFFRMESHKTQMSSQTGPVWLRALATKLGNSITDITRTGPNLTLILS